jgi:homocysteine S-methyltransferase
MPRYRESLPQLSGRLFLTDGGLETTLIFHEELELPYFAAFDLMTSSEGRATLRKYYHRYAQIAQASGAGFIFESPTWRASRDWAEKLGYSTPELADVNRAAIELMAKLRGEHVMSPTPMEPCPAGRLPSDRDDERGGSRALPFRTDPGLRGGTEADMIAAITMNYVEEAIGIVRAAAAVRMPVAISFTLETDGRLPTGATLQEAIGAVDRATGNAAAYFMVNCAHPSHFAAMLDTDEPWVERVRGLRANASRRSHAELDQARDLDAGDPSELGRDYRALRQRHPHINVLGGCCGTDHRHVLAIARSCVPNRLHAAYAA